MTNANPQTTADFWDAYIAAAEAASSVQAALCAPRTAARCASLPKEDRRAEDTDSETGDRDGTPLMQPGDCECQDRGYQPANGDHDDDRRRFEQDRGQGRRFRLTGLGGIGAH
jgi:hypothetical protein